MVENINYQSSSVNVLRNFLNKTEIQDLSKRIKVIKDEETIPRFNIFELISDNYHKENLHSDIIKFLLDPEELHNAKDNYLKLFLEYLSQISTTKNFNTIELNNYPSPKVSKEYVINGGRIDILITDTTDINNKRAIIIENKINNAGDTFRQLPTYFNYFKNRNYIIDRIVYLSMAGSKNPNREGWDPEEKHEINKRLSIIAAFNKNELDLYNGWIFKCLKFDNNPDVKFIIEHYGNLLKSLRGNIMEMKVIEDFNKILEKEDNYSSACSIKLLLEKLGNYLAKEIVDDYEENPYVKPSFFDPIVYADNLAVFDQWIYNDHKYCLTITCFYNKYEVRFFDKNGKYETIEFEDELRKFEMIWKQDGFIRNFYYPNQKSDLYKFLKDLLKELSKF